jgi:very-short-patch-repair endonuclease
MVRFVTTLVQPIRSERTVIKKQPNQLSRERPRMKRKFATKSVGLLWAALRRRQLLGKKFRRQHPIGPWIVDFTCFEHALAIEIDGGYYDEVIARDLHRQMDICNVAAGR